VLLAFPQHGSRARIAEIWMAVAFESLLLLEYYSRSVPPRCFLKDSRGSGEPRGARHHCAACVLWASVFENGPAALDAAFAHISVIAAVVHYAVYPRGLTPRWEEALRQGKMARSWKRAVICGGGAGGLELAVRLARRGGLDIHLVDPSPTHLWKPLLHEIASGTLDVAGHEISYLALAGWRGFVFAQGRLDGVDRENKTVRITSTLDQRGPSCHSRAAPVL
jgi:hypothetical protein